jgi:hypothetical protein
MSNLPPESSGLTPALETQTKTPEEYLANLLQTPIKQRALRLYAIAISRKNIRRHFEELKTGERVSLRKYNEMSPAECMAVVRVYQYLSENIEIPDDHEDQEQSVFDRANIIAHTVLQESSLFDAEQPFITYYQALNDDNVKDLIGGIITADEIESLPISEETLEIIFNNEQTS